jgi:hypothetical protein
MPARDYHCLLHLLLMQGRECKCNLQAQTYLQAKDQGRVIRLVAGGMAQIGRNDRYLQWCVGITQYTTV